MPSKASASGLVVAPTLTCDSGILVDLVAAVEVAVIAETSAERRPERQRAGERKSPHLPDDSLSALCPFNLSASSRLFACQLGRGCLTHAVEQLQAAAGIRIAADQGASDDFRPVARAARQQRPHRAASRRDRGRRPTPGALRSARGAGPARRAIRAPDAACGARPAPSGRDRRPRTTTSRRISSTASFCISTTRLREMALSDIAVSKRLKAMKEAFYGRNAAYAAALDSGSRAELAAALARNVYGAAGGAPEGGRARRLCRRASTPPWPRRRSRISPRADSAFRTARSRPEGSMPRPFSRVMRVDALPKEGQTVDDRGQPGGARSVGRLLEAALDRGAERLARRQSAWRATASG